MIEFDRLKDFVTAVLLPVLSPLVLRLLFNDVCVVGGVFGRVPVTVPPNRLHHPPPVVGDSLPPPNSVVAGRVITLSEVLNVKEILSSSDGGAGTRADDSIYTVNGDSDVEVDETGLKIASMTASADCSDVSRMKRWRLDEECIKLGRESILSLSDGL